MRGETNCLAVAKFLRHDRDEQLPCFGIVNRTRTGLASFDGTVRDSERNVIASRKHVSLQEQPHGNLNDSRFLFDGAEF